MRRKLIQQGKATLMVSLPADWAKAQKLSKGNEVELSHIGNSIIVSPGKIRTKEAISLSLIDETESSVRTLITAAYRKGYDVVNITYSSKKQLSLVRTLIKDNLLGFDILERTDTKIVIENITEPSYDHFENIFSKVFLSIQQLLDATIENTRKGKVVAPHKDIARRIQQYDNFCRRAIMKHALPKQKNEHVWTLLTKLVHASRELEHLSDSVTAPLPTIAKYLESCKQHFTYLHNAYLKQDISLLSPLHASEKRLIYKEGYALLKKKPHPATYHAMLFARQIYLCTSSISGMLL
ncbi:MAG: phosphate uptake regulator [Candidatus Woesearchaeota archaeon]|jgi:phosphate uptake regulator